MTKHEMRLNLENFKKMKDMRTKQRDNIKTASRQPKHAREN